MSRTRDYRLYLEDIFEALTRIEKYVSGLSFKEFSKDTKTIDAVVRNFEVIGEASKQIPDSMRDKYQEVPWKDMSGMRDILIHKYFEIALDVVWKTITERLPPLRISIKKILDEMEDA